MEPLVYKVSEVRTQIRIKVGTKPDEARVESTFDLERVQIPAKRKRGMTICTRLPPIDMREETLTV